MPPRRRDMARPAQTPRAQKINYGKGQIITLGPQTGAGVKETPLAHVLVDEEDGGPWTVYVQIIAQEQDRGDVLPTPKYGALIKVKYGQGSSEQILMVPLFYRARIPVTGCFVEVTATLYDWSDFTAVPNDAISQQLWCCVARGLDAENRIPALWQRQVGNSGTIVLPQPPWPGGLVDRGNALNALQQPIEIRRFRGCILTAPAAPSYVVLVDEVSTPAAGEATVDALPLPALPGVFDFKYDDPMGFRRGCQWAISSTPDVYTAVGGGASIFGNAEIVL